MFRKASYVNPLGNELFCVETPGSGSDAEGEEMQHKEGGFFNNRSAKMSRVEPSWRGVMHPIGPKAGSPQISSSWGQRTRRLWEIPYLAVKRFLRIDGALWGGAFAFNAFFSLFPLMVLLVTIASFFVDREMAAKEVIAHIESYVPISGEMQRQIFGDIAGVIKAREQAGVIALIILIWGAHQSFSTLICATNRAWGTKVHNWWQLPLKSFVVLGITAGALLLGMALPVLMKMAEGWLFPGHDLRSWVYRLASFSMPLLVIFFSLGLFYRLAPRRETRFAEVWAPALAATILLRAVDSGFVIYLKDFATLNAVYGAFGGMMALLLWIYLSGCVFIFGACLCAGQAQTGKTAGLPTSRLAGQPC